MTDEQQLIVRHVRLCGCGKIAGHDSICRPGRQPAGLEPDDVQRVDQAWEDTETERRAERWAKRKQQLDADRRSGRAGLDPLALHRLALQRAIKLSTVAAGQIASGRGGNDGHPAPPRQQELEDDPRWKGPWDVIERQLHSIHKLLDEAEGHGPVAERVLSAEEKDALIVDPANEGLSVAQLIQALGADVCGSSATVSRVRGRFRNGLCTRSGLPPEGSCRCPTCRRAL